MTSQVRHIAPFINDVFYITEEWWATRINPITGQTEIHRGIDLATTSNDPLYSMLNGHVHTVGYDSGQGNYLILVDDIAGSTTYGYATLYMHMDSISVFQGQAVVVGQQVGYEGTTGQSTGIHLHLAIQDISRFNWQWNYSYTESDYINPCDFMGIDNIEGTSWIYDGTPIPPTPTTRRNKFPWVLYANRIRTRNS